jgi:hypothetical protein
MLIINLGHSSGGIVKSRTGSTSLCSRAELAYSGNRNDWIGGWEHVFPADPQKGKSAKAGSEEILDLRSSSI